MTSTCWCLAPRLPTPWQIHATMCLSNSPARPVTQTVCQDARASESANLGKTCKYGVASAVVVADAVADATADIIATDADDTVDVAASIAGLSLLQFDKCTRALQLPNTCLG